ncbi:hypothetical protein DSECCO2_99210 [anaerobic digester metagenome]
MISFHPPNLKHLFCWLFFIMILSFGISGVLLVLETDKNYSNREGYSEFVIPSQGVEKARINLAIETGTVNISGQSMDDILYGKVHVDTKRYLPHLTHSETNGTVNIAIDRPSDLFHNIIGGEESWEFQFQNQTPISLILSIATGDIRLQPGNAQISEMVLECGAGSVFLDLQDYMGDSLPVRIDNGAGEITVLFPEKSHVSVALERALGNLVMSGFTGNEHGYYHETDDPNAPAIHVTISQGIGDLTLKTI